MDNLSDSIYYVTALISFILSSLLLFKKNISLYLKAFAPFIAIDILVSLLTIYMAKKAIHTIPIANALSTFEFCFYIWVFKCIINTLFIKRVCSILLISFPIAVMINVFLIQGFDNFHSLTYSIGCLILIFLSIYYFFELFQTQHAISLAKEPGFWIVSGLLFYYSVSFPLYVSVNLMKNFPIALGNVFGIVCSLMNFILYSLFCIAFICKIQIRKLFSS